MPEDLGAVSGSREPDPSCTGSGPSGFDPARWRVPMILLPASLLLLAYLFASSIRQLAADLASAFITAANWLAEWAHGASGMETRQGGNEVPSRSDDSPTAESGTPRPSQGDTE